MSRLALAALFLCACAGGAAPIDAPSRFAVGKGDGIGVAEAGLEGRVAKLRFTGDWRVEVEGELVAGGVAYLDYAPARARCTFSTGGHAAWSVQAHYRIGGGEVRSVHAAGHAPAPALVGVPIELGSGGDLEIWFENGDAVGCHEWDSNLGANYHFTVRAWDSRAGASYPIDGAADPRAPGWIGNAAWVIDRMTCTGGPCDASRRTLDGEPFSYGTYARQRAAIRAAFFDVWKEGVTDFDNPELWRQLDVQVHYRARGDGPFTSRYVDFFGPSGNDARYVIDLRALDPLAGPYSRNDPADCPDADLVLASDGVYVQTTLEFYFSANGVPLRRADGAAFRGVYEDYKDAFAICLPD